jgi:hypothetical protein
VRLVPTGPARDMGTAEWWKPVTPPFQTERGWHLLRGLGTDSCGPAFVLPGPTALDMPCTCHILSIEPDAVSRPAGEPREGALRQGICPFCPFCYNQGAARALCTVLIRRAAGSQLCLVRVAGWVPGRGAGALSMQKAWRQRASMVDTANRKVAGRAGDLVARGYH